jgi:hypothetical protein
MAHDNKRPKKLSVADVADEARRKAAYLEQRRRRDNEFEWRLRSLIKRVGGVNAAADRWDVAASAVSRWQNGSAPNREHLATIADCERISLDWLFAYEGASEHRPTTSMALARGLRVHVREALRSLGLPMNAVRAALPGDDQLLELIVAAFARRIRRRRKSARRALLRALRKTISARLQEPGISPEELSSLLALRAGFDGQNLNAIPTEVMSRLFPLLAEIDAIDADDVAYDDE